MKKFFLFLLYAFLFALSIQAQEHDVCGTWTYHYPGYYVNGEEIWPKRDVYLKIDETNGNYYVSIKSGMNGKFWGYSEATHVVCKDNGILSFNEFYDNKVRHDDGTMSHCYTEYSAWINGHTLHVKPISVGFWYDRYGKLYGKTETEQKPDAIWVFHNEKDNW